jgi:hypothetical protein
MYKQALEIAEKGLPCFPCLENKAPACAGGFKSATADAIALQHLWSQNSCALIGVPTGEISGFDVLDIDPRNGGKVWLDNNFDKLPITKLHNTRSGGWHFLFKHKQGLRSSANKIASGVDIRADGGYIIWWPATGLSVENHDVELAEWPEWLLEKLKPATQARGNFQPQSYHGSKYAISALSRATQSVASAAEGSRNYTLNKELWSILRFVKSGELDVQDVANGFVGAAMAAGLGNLEITKTFTSALTARGLS